MKKIKIDASKIGSLVFGIGVLSLFIWVMGSIIPIRTWISEDIPYTDQVFRCEMVDGKTRDFILNLPTNVEWQVISSRGSYYVLFQKPGINLFGKKSWTSKNEGCINGVLICNKVK